MNNLGVSQEDKKSKRQMDMKKKKNSIVEEG